MGFHRSGTSILYHVLHDTGHFSAVTPFHIVNRRRGMSHEELTRWFTDRGLRDRQYDSIPVGPDLPEEYGYALEHSSLTPRLLPQNVSAFTAFARSIQSQGRPMLLKNPWDTSNFLAVQTMLPDSRFIFIHRDPLAVISSQLRMFGAIIRRPYEYDMLLEEGYRTFCESPVRRTVARAICSDALPFLLWRVYRNVARCCDYMVENVCRLKERAMNLTYGQLCAQPNSSIRSILNFLCLDSELRSDYSRMIQPREPSLHPLVQRWRGRIEARTKQYCQEFAL